ncbi:hypothetical protein BJ742DRAFT_17689 [Cladochytrium replicatum]|nr:hypothetical protein BJ742DRAFT_17689 [Cladochytrium replicatum]
MSGSPTTTDDPYAAYASLILTSPTNPLADDQINNLHISYPLLWRRIIGLSVFCFFILATTILFVWYRKERAIRAHSVSLTIAQTVTILIGTPLTNMQMGIYGAYPCFFLFIGLYYGLVMWGLVVVGRALRLQIIFRFHKEAAANYLADVEGFNPANATGGDSIAEGVSGEGRSTPHRRRSRSRSSSSSQSMDSASRNLILGLGVQRRATRSAWIVIISAFCIITVYFLVIFFATNSIEIADDLFAFQHPLTVIGVEGKTKRGVQCKFSNRS